MIELALAQLKTIGGPIIIALIILSVAAASIAFMKIFEFMRLGVGRHNVAHDALGLWEAGDRRAAIDRLTTDRASVSRVLLRVMRATEDQNIQVAAIREDAFGFALDLLTRMRRHLRTLDTIVQAAPMLGLLGTVLGMIDVFGKLELGGGSVDPSQLAGGIWVALLTTALGLIVAIPFYFITSWLESRIENERIAIETSVAMVLARRMAGAPATTQVPTLRGIR